MTETWSWIGLFLLGGFHGINPAMGWLFAVALGLQERRNRVVWIAMAPLGAGHLAAVGAAVGVVVGAGAAGPLSYLRWPVAAMLIALGVFRLYRHRHPRGGAGMRVGMARLAWWSFLVATAHGAGLMVVPLYLGITAQASTHAGHAIQAANPVDGLLATVVHSTGYLLATALAAWLVLQRFGLMVLRTAWVNLDLVWAVALIGSGLITLVL
jgi:hypothetical protein